MKYYHGTIVGNIKVLQPYASPFSNIKHACVYMSTNKPLASIYIWNKPYKWMTFEISDDGIPIYKESFENGLKYFYNGVKGYIYTCEGNFTTDNATGIKHAVISDNPVDIVECDIVENTYERILQYEKEGLLIINHYEKLTTKQKEADKNMVMSAIKHFDLLNGNHPLSLFVEEKFRIYWEEAKKST